MSAGCGESSHNKRTGDEGEAVACQFLTRHGLQILERNYRYGHGEIDIIARDGEALVFCEVKTRFNDQFGDPECAITPRKQAQIRRIARGYLFEHRISDQICRFDVVAIRMYGATPDIRHIRNAFG